MLNYEDYCQAADLLRSRIGGFSPEVLLILGTGVGYLAEHIACLLYTSLAACLWLPCLTLTC